MRRAVMQRPSCATGLPSAGPAAANWPPAISQKVQAALQQAGFGEARVDARLDLDAERLCLDIHEGPRYVRGDVRIEGPGAIPVEALHQRLTRPYPPAARHPPPDRPGRCGAGRAVAG